MRLINTTSKSRLMILLILLPLAASCTSLGSHSPNYPQKLNVIKLSDGGICFDAESAKRLAQFKAELEAI